MSTSGSIVHRLRVISTVCLLPAALARADQPQSGVVRYRGVLESPGGELPFFIELTQRTGSGETGAVEVTLINGPERIAIKRYKINRDRIELSIDYYAATLSADCSGGPWKNAGLLNVPCVGTWKKRTGKDTTAQLGFRLDRDQGYLFSPFSSFESADQFPASVTGRWRIDFAGDDDPAVGVFHQSDTGQVEGTILTTTGDYRYLSGSYELGRLRLSAFDGAHALLFDARMHADGTMAGDFWSRDVWHDTWTATRDEHAELPDTFGITRAKTGVSLSTLRFRDLDGKWVSLDDPPFHGRPRIIEVFGSWCPNCHDASRLLGEFDARYHDRGLRIIGLAFELTGDFETDRRQVQRYMERTGVHYPVLIAGMADKDDAARALPILDKLRAYPTTIFIRQDGSVRAVHTGFSGPATGTDYEKLRERFELLIEEMLGDSKR